MAVLEAYAFTLETVFMPFARAYGNASGFFIVILRVPMQVPIWIYAPSLRGFVRPLLLCASYFS